MAARRKPPSMFNTGWTTAQVAVEEVSAMMIHAKTVGRKGWSHLIESRAPRFWPIVALMLVCAICGNSAADVWYVDVDNTSGPWNGTSWGEAFNTIQAGVDAASSGGEGEIVLL